MPQKVSLFFNQTNRGWTETFYSLSDTVSGELFPSDKAFLNASMQFRSPLTTLYGCRYSLLPPLRGSQLFIFNGVFDRQSASIDQQKPDMVSTDCQFVIKGDALSVRRIWIRGLPDVDTVRLPNGNDSIPGELLAGINTYMNKAMALEYCIRKQLSPFDGLQLFPIDSFEADASNPTQTKILVSQNPAGSFNVGDRIRFTGNIRSQLAGFPGSAKVLSITAVATQWQIKVKYRMRFTGVYFALGGMNLLKQQYSFQRIRRANFERFSKRDTGRPFGSLRGRRSAVARSQ